MTLSTQLLTLLANPLGQQLAEVLTAAIERLVAERNAKSLDDAFVQLMVTVVQRTPRRGTASAAEKHERAYATIRTISNHRTTPLADSTINFLIEAIVQYLRAAPAPAPSQP